MNRTRNLSLACAYALGAALFGLCSTGTQAASIVYGNFGPISPNVSFLQVTESSGTDAIPLYGAPSPFQVGLDFDPLAYVANSQGGSPDLTDGQLNFTVAGGGITGIGGIRLFEAGNYTLAGSGTPITSALAGAILRATVTEINFNSVSPIDLLPVNASLGFSLPSNPGVVQPWSLGLLLNVEGQLPSGSVATRVEVVIDNTLVATSEPGSVALITKSDFRVEILPVIVPEPGSMALFGLAAGALFFARRKRG